MALVPRTLRPSFIIRRKAMRRGVLGPSTFWKVVAAVVFGRSTLKRVFGRNVEQLDTLSVGVGTVLTVAATAPLTRKQAKREGISKASLEAAAWADLEASSPTS
jgi:hypothetical protein